MVLVDLTNIEHHDKPYKELSKISSYKILLQILFNTVLKYKSNKPHLLYKGQMNERTINEY